MIRIISQNIDRLYPPPNWYIIKLFESGELFTSTSQTFSIALKEKIFYSVLTHTQLPLNLYYLFNRGPPESWNACLNLLLGSGFSLWNSEYRGKNPITQ